MKIIMNLFYRMIGLLVSKDMCITAGIVGFLEAIRLEHIDVFLLILYEHGLNRNNFIENLCILH